VCSININASTFPRHKQKLLGLNQKLFLGFSIFGLLFIIIHAGYRQLTKHKVVDVIFFLPIPLKILDAILSF